MLCNLLTHSFLGRENFAWLVSRPHSRQRSRPSLQIHHHHYLRPHHSFFLYARKVPLAFVHFLWMIWAVGTRCLNLLQRYRFHDIASGDNMSEDMHYKTQQRSTRHKEIYSAIALGRKRIFTPVFLSKIKHRSEVSADMKSKIYFHRFPHCCRLPKRLLTGNYRDHTSSPSSLCLSVLQWLNYA